MRITVCNGIRHNVNLTILIASNKLIPWSRVLLENPVKRRSFQGISPNLRPCAIFLNYLRRGIVSPTLNHQTGVPPTVVCTRLLIQYIHSYAPYLDSLSSIHNRRTLHAVVVTDPFNMGLYVNRVDLVVPYGIAELKI
jgi:hypothetical protein